MNTNLGKNIIVITAGIIVILIGMAMLLGNVFGTSLVHFWRFFVNAFSILCSVAVIMLGVILIVQAQRKTRDLVIEKRLYRSTSGKMIGGVCAGIAEYFSIDPVVVRIIAVVLGLTSAYLIIPLYLILWVIVPPYT